MFHRPGLAVLSFSTFGLSSLLLAALPTLAQTYTAGAGLTLSGNKFSVATGGITGAMIGVPLSLSGSSSSPILTVTNTGSGYGVKTVSASGTGTYGTNNKYGNVGTLGDINGFGVYGSTSAGPYPYGVLGINRASGNGDYGILGGVDPVNKAPVGVFGGDSSTSGGNGVFGSSAKGTGIAAVASSASGTALTASNSATGAFASLCDQYSDGIYATAPSGHSAARFDGLLTVSAAHGGTGISATTADADGQGIYGINTSSGDYGFLGGLAPDYNTDYYPAGVYGYDDSSGGGEGVKGHSLSGDGVEGDSDSGEAVTGLTKTGLAGHFYGDVEVNGTLSAGAKDFRIDHPLDPEHKYLYHASVESDKMEDVYHGHVTTDAQGNASVTMPAWFQALNTDFEYQLTVVGQFAQAIVGTEIQDNKFTIKTDKPSVKVSWQVTGVRHDAFTLAHPLEVERDKPEKEQGLYQNPEAFGQPDSMGIVSLHGMKSKGQPKD